MSPPVFGHGHLRLYLLSVLDERDMHGYEIIQAISDRFGGTYVPSAGTIYPRLAKLEAEGLVTKADADGRRTVYSLTDAGRAELDARRAELDSIEEGVGDSVRRLADEVRASVSDAMASLRAELAAAAREARDETRGAARAAAAAARDARGTPSAPDAPPASSTPPSGTTEVRSESRAQLARAEALLADFRQEVRADLRRAIAAGRPLDAAAVDALAAALSTLRTEVSEGLR